MFSNYLIKKSEFSIHFKNGYFVVIEIPKIYRKKGTLIEEIEELFAGDYSDTVTVTVFNYFGNIVQREECLEPPALLDLLNKIKDISASN